MTVALRGLIPVLATPFDAGGRLDETSLARLVEFEVAAGADGLAIFGLASEAFALSAEDRAKISAVVRNVTAGAVPVVAGVNATALQPAAEQAAAAVEGGADALMVLPPMMVKPSQGQILDFYGELSVKVDVPIMVQDAPNATGVTMPPALLIELAKLDGVAAEKIEAQPSVPKIAAIAQDAASPDCMLFGGQNALFCLEEFAAGAAGTMPACEFTDVLAEVLQSWATGHHDQARRGFNRLLPLVRFGLQPGLAWAVHKEVLVHRGIITDAAVRSPASSLDQHTARSLRHILEDLQLPPLATAS